MLNKIIGNKHIVFIFMLSVMLLMANILAVCAAPNLELYDKTKSAQTEVLKNLEIVVNIESPTGYEKGLTEMGNFMVQQLQELGAKVETIPATGSAVGFNIVATLEGTGTGNTLMLAHIDTVHKVGSVAERPFRIENGKAYGPGVSDDKGGLILGLQALKLIKEMNYTNFGKIVYLINCDEEKGSFGSRDLIMEKAKDSNYAIGLEPGIPGDEIMSWRKGIGYYFVEVKGQSAHAGIEPEKGRNAVMELAHQVLQLSKLGDEKKMTSINFTIFQAGGVSNIIPDYAKAQADVRVLYPEEYSRLEKEMNEVAKNKLIPGTEVKIIATKGRPPFPKSPQSEAFAAKFADIYNELGLKLNIVGSGGGSDANYAASVGTTAVDGLGIVGGGDHTPQEYIDIESIPSRLYMLTKMLMDLGVQK
ncbi:glutamate carboxypeptidase [Pelosinus sp. sgz500959]|uniref:glutamate carboxypeptidase n=1 Tax=Pelosinus sp. sgz500959 TaxID=3242472 RepID=UPI00367104C3